jgi:hypothetical protein
VEDEVEQKSDEFHGYGLSVGDKALGKAFEDILLNNVYLTKGAYASFKMGQFTGGALSSQSGAGA